MTSFIHYLDRIDKTIYENLFLYADPPWLVSLSHFLVKSYLLIPFLLVFFYFYMKYSENEGLWKKLWFIALVTVILLATSENIANLVKNIFERHRPIYQMGIYISEGGYSFPSAHALNTMAFAAFWGSRFPASKNYVYTMSVVIGLARMMANYHFPGDILGGWFLGFIAGKTLYYLALKFENRLRVMIERRQKYHA